MKTQKSNLGHDRDFLGLPAPSSLSSGPIFWHQEQFDSSQLQGLGFLSFPQALPGATTNRSNNIWPNT